MKYHFRLISLLSVSFLVVSCGQRSNTLGLGGGYKQTYAAAGVGSGSGDFYSQTLNNSSSPRQSFYSGTTGSPNTIAPGTGLVANGNSVSGVDFWGRPVQTTATDPQTCADLYNKYQRFPGNFQPALAVLTSCLNRVMINKNPQLFQQYQTLQQGNYPYYR